MEWIFLEGSELPVRDEQGVQEQLSQGVHGQSKDGVQVKYVFQKQDVRGEAIEGLEVMAKLGTQNRDLFMFF